MPLRGACCVPGSFDVMPQSSQRPTTARLALLVRLGAAILLGTGTYILTIFALGHAIDWLGEQHSLRRSVGAWWVASQPFAFGVFFLSADSLVW